MRVGPFLFGSHGEPMATESYESQLERVQRTIAELERGREVRRGERVFTALDLDVLYARERWLRRRVGRAARGGIRIRQAVPL